MNNIFSFLAAFPPCRIFYRHLNQLAIIRSFSLFDELQKGKVIYKIKNSDSRDDLLSISIVLGKKDKIDTYKLVLKEVIDKMRDNFLLTEEILKENIRTIYQGVYNEKDITIDFLTIKLSKIYTEAKLIYESKKPKIRGSFSL